MNPPSLKSSNISHTPKRKLWSHTWSATLLYDSESMSLASDSATLSRLPCQWLVWPVPCSAHFGAASPPIKNANYMSKRPIKTSHQHFIAIPKYTSFPLFFGSSFTSLGSNVAVISSSILILPAQDEPYYELTMTNSVYYHTMASNSLFFSKCEGILISKGVWGFRSTMRY